MDYNSTTMSNAYYQERIMRVAWLRQEWDTPTHLIKIPNLDVLLKIDWMMVNAVRTCYHRQFSIG